MKKGLLFLAACVLLTFGAQAQSAGFKASVRKLMAVSGSDATLKMSPEQILSMIEQQAPALPESVKVEIQAMFSEEALLSLMDRMVPIYAKYYTQQDMDDLIAFYDTPLGKKLSTVQPQITLESMSVAQQWAAEIGQKVAAKIMQSGVSE